MTNVADLWFPYQGLDLASAHDLQRLGTTPVATNVRAFVGGRMRGGSRPGLARYIDATVNGAAKIQHLNYIVTTTEDALPREDDDDDVWDETLFQDDPSDNGAALRNLGRRIRRGGSGIRPNRNFWTQSRITFVQENSAGPQANAALEVAFDNSVLPGNLLIVAVGMHYDPVQIGTITPTVTVTDSRGNSYSQAGTYDRRGETTNSVGFATAIFYTVNSLDTASANTVTVTPSHLDATTNTTAAVLEYTGAAGSSVLRGSCNSGHGQTQNPQPTASTGVSPATVGAVGELGIATFVSAGSEGMSESTYSIGTHDSATVGGAPGPGTQRSVVASGGGIRILVIEKRSPGLNGFGAKLSNFTSTDPNVDFVAAGATFKHA